jgi:hypothetical protein
MTARELVPVAEVDRRQPPPLVVLRLEIIELENEYAIRMIGADVCGRKAKQTDGEAQGNGARRCSVQGWILMIGATDGTPFVSTMKSM